MSSFVGSKLFILWEWEYTEPQARNVHILMLEVVEKRVEYILRIVESTRALCVHLSAFTRTGRSP